MVTRRVNLPAALTMLGAALLGATLVMRASSPPRSPAVPPPHAAAAPSEPSADNVSANLANRLHALRKNVEADPTDTVSVLELARLLHDGHQPEEAAAWYRRYLDENPDNIEAWFDLADSHARTGDLAGARDVLRALLEVAPGESAALYDMGAIELRLGHRSAARDWFERAARAADPNTARLARQALENLETDR